jgi:SAM-dependent methyltransferase
VRTTVDKQNQAAHYDNIAEPEFEINRPHGEPRVYQRLMRYKLERVLSLLDEPVRQHSVLTICCGSGMDAEFLSEQGAGVIAMDISMGALKRARERARRYGTTYELAVADAECLPFRDRAFDYCFVHDGLHHLPRPEMAVREMARVSRRGILITEPADAGLTSLAIRAGILEAYEESGNFVVRFRPRDLAALCAQEGLDAWRSCRYMMRYGHPPARWWRRLDQPVLLAIADGAFRLFGVHLMGRVGNKLAFAAVRATESGRDNRDCQDFARIDGDPAV